MDLKFNTTDFVWYTAELWPDKLFTIGTYISFSRDLTLAFDCAKEEALAMIFPSFRYGIPFEIYGIAGSIAGYHLGFISDDCLNKNTGSNVNKKWLLKNWNDNLGASLAPLNEVRFSKGYN